MKRKKQFGISLITIACLFSASCEPVYERDRGRFDGRETERTLTGAWYVNGDRDKRAEIISTGEGLEARNERGDTTRLAIERDGDIRALDWEGGIRGNVRRDTIEWANGTVWTHEPSRR